MSKVPALTAPLRSRGALQWMETPVLLAIALAGLGVALVTATAIGIITQNTNTLFLSLAGIGALAAVTTLRWPETGALVLLFVLLTRVSDLPLLDAAPISANQLIVGLLLGAMLFRRLVLRREGLVTDRVLAWMLVYGAAILVSIVAATDRVATLAALVSYLRDVLIVFILVNLITTMAGLRLGIWTMVAAGTFLAALAILQLRTGYDFGGLARTEIAYIASGEEGVLLSGSIGDSNYFAQLLTIVVPLALYGALGERRLSLRLVALAAVMLLCIVIVWTFSRGGLLALLTALGLAAVSWRRNPTRLLVFIMIGGIVALAAPAIYWDRIDVMVDYFAARTPGLSNARNALVAPASVEPAENLAGQNSSAQAPPAPPTSQDSSRQITPEPQASSSLSNEPPPLPEGDGSIQARSKLWRVGAQMFLDHPLTGIGQGNYYSTYPQYAQRVDASLPLKPAGAHNTPVQIAAETGVIGLMAFAAVIIAALLGLRDGRGRLKAAAFEDRSMRLESIEIAIYTYLVSSMFLNNTFPRYLWMLLALGIIGYQCARRASMDAPTSKTAELVVAETD